MDHSGIEPDSKRFPLGAFPLVEAFMALGVAHHIVAPRIAIMTLRSVDHRGMQLGYCIGRGDCLPPRPIALVG